MPSLPSPAYTTASGAAYCGDSLELLATLPDGGVNLCITSPPFALRRQKSYGNLSGTDYLDWLEAIAGRLKDKLAEDGSLVLDLGGAYEPGAPERSLYNFRVLLRLCDGLGYHLAQDFYWNNPARLPSPIEWVNKRKVRAKDTVDTVWWLGRSRNPKADTTRVLSPYSTRMRKLIDSKGATYTTGLRPSGHQVGDAFVKDNGGALPSNLLDIPNTESNSPYLARCRRLGIKPHPARFPGKLPQFFVRMLTDPGDTVLDIFAGSNTTGAVAEAEGRKWMAFDTGRDYLAASAFRFMDGNVTDSLASRVHADILGGRSVDLCFPRPTPPCESCHPILHSADDYAAAHVCE